jgi:preprotein translocase subunit SecY
MMPSCLKSDKVRMVVSLAVPARLAMSSLSIDITVVCLVPEFLVMRWNVPFYFGGTSLLIIVVVTMDFMAQVQAYMMSHQYDSLLKKANFKGANIPMR